MPCRGIVTAKVNPCPDTSFKKHNICEWKTKPQYHNDNVDKMPSLIANMKRVPMSTKDMVRNSSKVSQDLL